MLNKLEGKRAILYRRVSTSDQKQFGNSLNSQRSNLQEFCERNSMHVVKEYQEDYSAKTFDRPEYQKLLEFAIKNKSQIDYFLIADWSRFSRNTLGALQVIEIFERLNIEINCIDHWIDYEDPNQKLMQLMYLGIPEVDNKVRSKKVRTGMRQGLKEGRWNCSQPKGYIPGKDELGKVLMQPDPVKAPLIKQLFEDFATGAFAQSEILKMPKYKLLGLSTSHLSRMLQFELYAGWVRVPAYKDEPEELIRGLHDPIIDEETFEKVQTQLGLRRKLKQKHSKLSEYLPLRGFLQCNTCGGNLTGSASTSKTGKKHYYYHCNAKYGCKERIKVSDAHNAFDLLLQSITPKEEVCDLFKVILEDKYKSSTESKHSQIELIKTDIKKTEARKQVLTNKLVDDIIDNETYTSSRKVYDAKIIQLNGQLLDLGSEDDDVREFVDFGTRLLTNIHYFYSKSTVQLKQKLLSSILEGKLIFTGEKYRTPFFKEAISFITGNIKALEKIKSKKGNALSNVSLQVVLTTQFSNSFYSNLRELKELQQCYIDEGLASKDGAFLIPKGKPEQLVLPNRI